MSVAEFVGFSASFVPFIIVVAAIAVTVVQRNLRAPVMFAGIIISAFLFAGFLWLTASLLGDANPAPDPSGAGGAGDRTMGDALREALQNTADQGAQGCNTLMLPYITTGLIPRGNAFFMSWVTAYLAWSQSQWNKAGGTPVNAFVWTGMALAWALIAWNWNAKYGPDQVTCGGLAPSAATMLAGTSLGLAYGAIIGAVSPTTLYFAPLASDNVVCSAPRRSVFSCTIGGTPPN
jgi:hypothetical protein